jgi:hypothetical protein
MIALALVTRPGHPPWQYLLLALVVSGVFLISSRQDVGLGAAIGAGFSQFMALFVLVALVVTALVSKWWIEALVGIAALCVEAWLTKRWWFSG